MSDYIIYTGTSNTSSTSVWNTATIIDWMTSSGIGFIDKSQENKPQDQKTKETPLQLIRISK